MRFYFISILALFLSRHVWSYNTHKNNAQKFNFLLIQSESDWGPLIRGPDAECSEKYESYLRAREERDWYHVKNWVYDVSDCILSKAPELRKKNLDNAVVLLGLTPILFATIGPSLTELGLVSLQRPLLAVFLSLGSAAVLPSRVLSYYDDDAKDVMARQSILDKSLGGWIYYENTASRAKRKQHYLYCAIFGILEYIFAGAAAFNIIYASWQLGVASVFTADCPTSFYPMIWSLLPLVVHLFSSGALYANKAIQCRTVKKEATMTYEVLPLNVSDQISKQNMPSNHIAKLELNEETSLALHAGKGLGFRRRFVAWMGRQFLSSIAHPALDARVLEPSKTMIMIHNFATILGFAQVVYGTLIFSALLFVSPADAAILLLRFMASVVICRLLIAFELGGLRLKMEELMEGRKY